MFKKALFLIVSALFLYGCSLSEAKNGSVTFRVDGELAEKIAEAASSRSAFRVLTADEAKNLFIDITLKGGYFASRTIPAVDGALVVFNDIPEKTLVYVQAEAYRWNEEKQRRTILYSGTSAPILIAEGSNFLSLVMKSMGGVSVTINPPAKEGDLAISYERVGTKLIFTLAVAEGESVEIAGTGCIWYVDGMAQAEKGGRFTLETNGLAVGTYEIEVVCGDKSAMATVQIEE